jgi:hypothetical protein
MSETHIDLTLFRQILDRVDPFMSEWTKWCYGKNVSEELARLFQAYSELRRRAIGGAS